jgi:hypothetical protein
LMTKMNKNQSIVVYNLIIFMRKNLSKKEIKR